MSSVTLILGDQLFHDHPSLHKNRTVLMIESKEICNRYNYHKFKIAYIFSCMRQYAQDLEKEGYTVTYYSLSDQKIFADVFTKEDVKELHYLQPTDKSFRTFLQKLTEDKNIHSEIVHENKMFLTPASVFDTFFEDYSEPYLMHDFYLAQRKRLKLFVTDNDKPYKGSWSFDKDNRKKTPKDYKEPDHYSPNSEIYDEVVKDVERFFPENPGNLPQLYLPTSHAQAKEYLQHFFEHKLALFGDYEDAIDDRTPFLHHSILSPLLNNGLLTPQLVLDTLNDFLDTNPEILEDHFNSVEGFVRQLIGWREWMWGLYNHVYEEDLDQYNFFEHTKDLPKYFYFEELEKLENPPLKNTLLKTEEYAYNHHIERLMILANWMTLSEYNPQKCFQWFMEMYVDAYDWVMVGNVIGMGLFADEGKFATKPYVAGGNYIKKMSHYKKGDWEKVWTDKFWDFLLKHEDFFKTNPRMNMLIVSKKKRMAAKK